MCRPQRKLYYEAWKELLAASTTKAALWICVLERRHKELDHAQLPYGLLVRPSRIICFNGHKVLLKIKDPKFKTCYISSGWNEQKKIIMKNLVNNICWITGCSSRVWNNIAQRNFCLKHLLETYIIVYHFLAGSHTICVFTKKNYLVIWDPLRHNYMIKVLIGKTGNRPSLVQI